MSPATLKQVKPGETTKEWLIAMFGKPTTEQGVAEGVEILGYEAVRKAKGQVTIFLLLHTNIDEEKRTTVYFELKDGIVQKHWKTQT